MSKRFLFSVLGVGGVAGFSGAMLIIGLVLGTYWKSLPPEQFLDWFSLHSHLVARAIPVFIVPALLGLIGGAVCDRAVPMRRNRWLAALACMAGILLITIIYHLPMNSVFNAKSVAIGEVGPMLDRWLWLHAVRIVLGVAASIFAIAALRGGMSDDHSLRSDVHRA